MKTLQTAIAATWLVLAPIATPAAHAANMPPGIAWAEAKATKDIDAAFGKARAEKKPVLLYWGATWCPPCNQLKATLFNRQDFIALSRTVLPVHLDGDLPGAQALGHKFKVIGYPTLILFDPQGNELTRLPGEADPIRIVESMQRTLAGARSTRAILADARAGKPLPNAEWQALAFYSWGTDATQLASDSEVGALLAELADKSAQGGASPEIATRLWLKALAALGDTPGAASAAPANAYERLRNLLADEAQVTLHADVILGGARDLVRGASAPQTAERAALIADFDSALKRLHDDTRLSRADRTDALISRVGLARIDVADNLLAVSLPPALLDEVRAHAKQMDSEITSAYERQAVMTSTGYLLRFAGLADESNALLTANLKKSHSPYYLMGQLGGNARLQGKPAESLSWHERAYQESKGPATRLQWGATYVGALFDLTPTDTARIERAVGAVLADAARDSGAFYDRSGRSLQKIAKRAAAWQEAEARARVQQRFAALCKKLPARDPQRASCEGLWPTS